MIDPNYRSQPARTLHCCQPSSCCCLEMWLPRSEHSEGQELGLRAAGSSAASLGELTHTETLCSPCHLGDPGTPSTVHSHSPGHKEGHLAQEGGQPHPSSRCPPGPCCSLPTLGAHTASASPPLSCSALAGSAHTAPPVLWNAAIVPCSKAHFCYYFFHCY